MKNQTKSTTLKKAITSSEIDQSLESLRHYLEQYTQQSFLDKNRYEILQQKVKIDNQIAVLQIALNDFVDSIKRVD